MAGIGNIGAEGWNLSSFIELPGQRGGKHLQALNRASSGVAPSGKSGNREFLRRAARPTGIYTMVICF
jgi:hypothetical protein